MMASSHSNRLRLNDLSKFTSDSHRYDLLIGKLIYLKEEGTSDVGVWATARLKSHDGTGKFVASMMYDNTIIVTLEEKDLLIVNEHAQSDICKLEFGHEPAIIANIGQRFVQGNFFSAMGPGLIFVNPRDRAHLDEYKLSSKYYDNYMHSKYD